MRLEVVNICFYIIVVNLISVCLVVRKWNIGSGYLY